MGMFLPVLLASGLVDVTRVVGGAYDYLRYLRLAVGGVGDVKRARGVPAPVRTDEHPVDEHLRLVVHRTKVQEHPLVLTVRRKGHPAPVPDDPVETRLFDARSTALRGERHDYRPVEDWRARLVPALVEPSVVIVKGELPWSAKVGPLLTHQSRPRVAHLDKLV
jgi:hypothetical protein